MRKIMTSASVLSADMTNVSAVAKRLDQSGVDMLHFDVMDGIFVPNLTFGMPILDAFHRSTEMFLDVHLMIADPLRYISQFAKAGADLITFHLESQSDPYQTIRAIRDCGIQAGIVLKPGTPYEEALPFLPLVDVVLVMTVEPGFGGQSFMQDMMPKVRALREAVDAQGLSTKIQVDGGINPETAKAAVSAGAEILVVGSYLFKQENMADGVAALQQAAAETQTESCDK